MRSGRERSKTEIKSVKHQPNNNSIQDIRRGSNIKNTTIVSTEEWLAWGLSIGVIYFFERYFLVLMIFFVMQQ